MNKLLKQYKYLFIIYLSSFLSILGINFFLSIDTSSSDKLYKVIHRCYFLHESPLIKWLTSSRGKNYYTITDNKKKTTKKEEEEHNNKHSYCLVSLWAITHVCLYTVIGFVCPDLFIESFIFGALFEYFEKYKWSCHDSLDVIFNSIGFLIGYIINRVYKKL